MWLNYPVPYLVLLLDAVVQPVERQRAPQRLHLPHAERDLSLGFVWCDGMGGGIRWLADAWGVRSSHQIITPSSNHDAINICI